MSKLLIRPRYKAKETINDRLSIAAKSLEALPAEVQNQLRVVKQPKTNGSHVQSTTFVEADDHAIDRIRATAGKDVVVEPLIKFHKTTFDMLRAGPLDIADILRAEEVSASFAGTGQQLTINVRGRQRSHVPLAYAEVHLVLMGNGGVRDIMKQRTNDNGDAVFEYADFYEILAVIVVPYTQFWPRIIRGGTSNRKMNILCEPLPDNGPSGWWHDALGVSAQKSNGQDIKIGVIDSGCGPHDALDHVKNRGSFILGEYDPDGGEDSGSHGTHVCGIIGAYPNNHPLPYYGLAPGAHLSSIRVFPENDAANQGDIADAMAVFRPNVAFLFQHGFRSYGGVNESAGFQGLCCSAGCSE